jgi:hypothetical protein
MLFSGQGAANACHLHEHRCHRAGDRAAAAQAEVAEADV